ncbi:MAG: hypothetical protein OP8BY_0508 [Candidatus Saccharicenans subterraneus]|uniref:Uncharacterized protein n=1 Tax=Candidatus Saccharicenans subterraneus TaxID=2508984 RepID=A0A3E2BKE5_9BACT|nr:MAG: hypothetical protein OP8BY_0508 [Candidatus Saccharicenans subterraneum]
MPACPGVAGKDLSFLLLRLSALFHISIVLINQPRIDEGAVYFSHKFFCFYLPKKLNQLIFDQTNKNSFSHPKIY